MNLKPINQTILYGFNKTFNDLVKLYNVNSLPNKILFSGQKGIGKSTLSYHFINYILSIDEDHKYLRKPEINTNNKSYLLVKNEPILISI